MSQKTKNLEILDSTDNWCRGALGKVPGVALIFVEELQNGSCYATAISTILSN